MLEIEEARGIGRQRADYLRQMKIRETVDKHDDKLRKANVQKSIIRQRIQAQNAAKSIKGVRRKQGEITKGTV